MSRTWWMKRVVENCSPAIASRSRSRLLLDGVGQGAGDLLDRVIVAVEHQRRFVADDLHLAAAARHPDDRRRRAPVQPEPCRSALRASRECHNDATPSARAPRRATDPGEYSIHGPSDRASALQRSQVAPRVPIGCADDGQRDVGHSLADPREDPSSRARSLSPARCVRPQESRCVARPTRAPALDRPPADTTCAS